MGTNRNCIILSLRNLKALLGTNLSMAVPRRKRQKRARPSSERLPRPSRSPRMSGHNNHTPQITGIWHVSVVNSVVTAFASPSGVATLLNDKSEKIGSFLASESVMARWGLVTKLQISGFGRRRKSHPCLPISRQILPSGIQKSGRNAA